MSIQVAAPGFALRSAIGIGLSLLALGAACASGETPEEGLTPSVREVAPSALGLESYVGRWEAITDREGQDVILAPCDRENHFVELRSDGEGGWELLAGVGGELRVLVVTATEPSPGGVRILLDGEEPLTVTWIEPDRTASMLPLFPAETFVASRHRADLPKIVQPASECP